MNELHLHETTAISVISCILVHVIYITTPICLKTCSQIMHCITQTQPEEANATYTTSLYPSQRGNLGDKLCATGSSSMALCARSEHITVYDVTTEL